MTYTNKYISFSKTNPQTRMRCLKNIYKKLNNKSDTDSEMLA